MNRTSHLRILAVGDLKVGMNQAIVVAADGAIAATQIGCDIRCAEGARRSPVVVNVKVRISYHLVRRAIRYDLTLVQ